MKFSRTIALAFFAAPAVVTAFTASPVSVSRTSSLSMASPFFSTDIATALDKEVSYSPGKADTDFARKYGHLAGVEVKTVGEAFTTFTDILGTPVNALYKGICTDLVGSLHLILVNARFVQDPVFSFGLVSVLELVLKNYPEQDTAKRIKSAMITSVGLDEAAIDADAAKLQAWAQGKTRDEIASALKGEGDSMLSEIATGVKGDEYWMYSRFFGIGLIKMMEMAGVEQDMSVAYDVMEDWMNKCLGKAHFTACSDSDLYFKQKGKLDMMETMMKEIEIREKKRMADRLEAKAEMALIAVDKAEKMEIEIQKEAAKEAANKEETIES
mmetsp:Transcript_14373/g.22623  ORF Transcript_14373/g.22623 Transcript_14373/m.22623 type:complete len:327 (+) Transcript_14373:38-1018(+)|eukprot:CAMPEP_0201599290 /NCGR_PEP_ID=MMETSP0492-20130828/808_1 /ASSEMBLY_ACC=CAM_ASM_000837 /TAXON_ID=420259 /ORGANISM="Thalassiosira gravida, Strain GMp14c1" /LENGTH=326 /DNA_ID=CAMNT_0048061847 /DNA_START=24 /DNA_END=1004 /DNA_ORIENTATION=-